MSNVEAVPERRRPPRRTRKPRKRRNFDVPEPDDGEEDIISIIRGGYIGPGSDKGDS